MMRLFGFVWMFFGLILGFGHSGYVIYYTPPFALVSPGEFNIWLAQLIFIAPGALMIFWSPRPQLIILFREVCHRLETASWQMRVTSQLGGVTFLAIAYRLGRSFFLRDLPITDEEYTGQFGGRVLTSGRWMVDLGIDPQQMPTLFLLERGESWTSVDFLGIQLAWAFSELTQTGPWIFAVIAALTVFVVYLAVREICESTSWALLGASIYTLSPMASLLSFTTHAHILSRFFLVLFVLFVFRTVRRKQILDALMLGLVFGCGVLCRPAEILTLTAPFWFYLGFHLFRERPTLFLAIVLGGLPTLTLFIFHNVNVSGIWWQTPRMAENSYPSVETLPFAFLNDPTVLLRRIADNLLNNTMFTLLYWHGAMGLVLVVLGLSRRTIPLLFLIGLAVHASVALFHDNDGVRVVGPIHFSEWVIYLSILATFGLKRLEQQLQRIEIRDIIPRIGLPLLLVSIFTTSIIGLSIRSSNAWHEHFYTFIDASVPANSVILAPRHGYFWRVLPPRTYNGSWVFESRAPKVDLTDDVLILRYTSNSEGSVIKRFPNRRVFIARPSEVDPFISILEVER